MIEYANFWPGFNPVFDLDGMYDILRGGYEDLVSSEDKVVLMRSVFGVYEEYGKHVDCNVLLNWESRPYCGEYDLRFVSNFEDGTTWAPMLLYDTQRLRVMYFCQGFSQPSCLASFVFSNVNTMRGGFCSRLVERCGERGVLVAGKNGYSNSYIENRQEYRYGKLRWMVENRTVFNICPENAFVDGYNTEKIRDAYLARQIPVYWGSRNRVEEYIPEGSYIWLDPENYDGTIDQMLEVAASPEKQVEMLSKAPIEKLCERTAEQIIGEGIKEFFSKLSR